MYNTYIEHLNRLEKLARGAFPTTTKLIAPKECTTRYLLRLWMLGVRVNG